MKKIALNYIYLSKKHAGGKDQVGLNLLKGFREMGAADKLAVICFDYSVTTIKELFPEVEVIGLKSKSFNNEMLRMAYLLFVNSTRIYKLTQSGAFSMIYHLSCNNGLRKFPIPSIVIPHDIKAVAHRQLGRVKIPWYKYWIYRIMYALDFLHADRIIAISEFDKSEMIQYYPKYRHKIYRIYNPIVVNRVQRWCPKEDAIVAVNVQFHHKNTITLIKAMEKIQNIVPHKLYLVGSVPKRMEYLKTYVKEHNLEERVIFTGFLTDEKLTKLLTECSLYVNPTLYEGFGMTAVEAMLMEVPTLVSKVASNFEVTCQECNYYEPADDVDALADSLVECLKRAYEKNKLQEAREKLENRYNYRGISEEYMQCFQSME